MFFLKKVVFFSLLGYMSVANAVPTSNVMKIYSIRAIADGNVYIQTTGTFCNTTVFRLDSSKHNYSALTVSAAYTAMSKGLDVTIEAISPQECSAGNWGTRIVGITAFRP